MLAVRVIPCLLLKGEGLVKTRKFGDPVYLGDPRNAVKLFNDLEVDELVLLDIEATRRGRIQYDLLEEIVSEAFMPVAYGGGIRTLEEAGRLVKLGVEKLVINSEAFRRPEFIGELARGFGSQSVVVCLDIRPRRLLAGHVLHSHAVREGAGGDPVAWAKRFEALGAGELILQAVDRDGVMEGYDLDILKRVSRAVSVPCVAMGGAGRLEDLRAAVEVGGVQAVAAGSLFVFHGPHRAVLINYPSHAELEELFGAGDRLS